MTRRNIVLALVAALAIGSSPLLFSDDGVIEINQARASTGSVTPGDAPGFPVTLSESGSYVLTGNLTLPDADTTGIVVEADDVTIDLNGFAIQGPTVCSLPDCLPLGEGRGILTEDTSNMTVRNGTIRGTGREGILTRRGTSHRAENVRVVSCGAAGIRFETPDSVVMECSVVATDYGIFTDRGGTVAHSTCSNNTNGITTGEASLVVGNTASGNTLIGIFGGDSSVVKDNVATGNGGGGIAAGSASTLSGNTASNNEGDGIRTLDGSTVLGNASNGNSGFGIWMFGSSSGYGNNVVSNNAGGTVFGGTQIGINLCDASTTCP